MKRLFISFFIMVAASCITVLSQSDETEVSRHHVMTDEEVKCWLENDTTIAKLEDQPEYPGGMDSLMAFLGRNIVYPTEAAQQGVKGKVLVRFIVDKKGNIKDPELMWSIHPLLGAEAIRVVKLIKGFKPGRINGQPVNVWFTLPLTFSFQP